MVTETLGSDSGLVSVVWLSAVRRLAWVGHDWAESGEAGKAGDHRGYASDWFDESAADFGIVVAVSGDEYSY